MAWDKYFVTEWTKWENDRGDITLAAIRQFQRASKIISPFIIFAVFDVSFRRYKL